MLLLSILFKNPPFHLHGGRLAHIYTFILIHFCFLLQTVFFPQEYQYMYLSECKIYQPVNSLNELSFLSQWNDAWILYMYDQGTYLSALA